MTGIATSHGRASTRPVALRPPGAAAVAVVGVVTALLSAVGVAPAAATELVAAGLLAVAAVGSLSLRGVSRSGRLLAVAAAAAGALALVSSSAGRETPASLAAAAAGALALAAVAGRGSGASSRLTLLDAAVAAVAVAAVALDAGPPASVAAAARITSAALLAATLATLVARGRPPAAAVAGVGGFLLAFATGGAEPLRVLAAAALVLAVAGETDPPPARARRSGPLLVSAVPVAVLVAAVAARSPGDPLLVGLAVTTVLAAARILAGARISRLEDDAERDRLLAAVAHDLRTPLTAVAGFADVLADGWESLPDEERRDMLAVVREEAHRLARIVGDLTLLAGDELDAVALDRSRFDGKGLVAEAVSLVFDLSSGPPPVRARVEPYLELVGDRERILEAVTALLDNAYRYGGGRVLVVARREDGRRIIEVHDDGSGIDPRDVGVLWERFRRGSQDGGRVAGAGLGLARVRALAHAHGGEASYRRSEELGGACFALDLPYGET